MPNRLLRLLALLATLAALSAACGDDGGDEESSTSSSTTVVASTTSTTEPGEATTTTTSIPLAPTTTPPADGTTGVLSEGSLTTAGSLTADWSLTATADSLCFDARLSHPDPGVAEAVGEGVAACVEPPDDLDAIDGGLSVDIGTVDGEKTIGYLWGRVAPGVVSLTIEHTDGTQTPIDILDGPTDVGVFVYVVEIASIPPVQDLDAVSGTQIEGSVAIRGFLRTGPTYPVVTPPPPSPPPEYPVS